MRIKDDNEAICVAVILLCVLIISYAIVFLAHNEETCRQAGYMGAIYHLDGSYCQGLNEDGIMIYVPLERVEK